MRVFSSFIRTTVIEYRMASDGERERGILSTKDRNYLGSGAGIAPKAPRNESLGPESEKRLHSSYLDFEFSSTN